MIACFHLSIPHPYQPSSYLFDDVSFDIEAGTWTEFTGPAGCGKSILFSILSLRALPNSGQLLVAGRNIERLRATHLAELRRKVGSRTQIPQLLECRSVIENLILPLVVRGESDTALKSAEELLKTVDLMHLRDVSVGRLCAHEQRVLGSLMALIGKPEIILLDGALEDIELDVQKRLATVLEQCRDNGSAVITFGRKRSEICPSDGVEYKIQNASLNVSEGAAQAHVRQLSEVRGVV